MSTYHPTPHFSHITGDAPIFTPPLLPLILLTSRLTIWQHLPCPPLSTPDNHLPAQNSPPYNQSETPTHFSTYRPLAHTHTQPPPNIPSIRTPPTNPLLLSVTPVDRWYICMKMTVGHCPIVNCQSPLIMGADENIPENGRSQGGLDSWVCQSGSIQSDSTILVFKMYRCTSVTWTSGFNNKSLIVSLSLQCRV